MTESNKYGDSYSEQFQKYEDKIAELKETLAQTIENDEVNYETLKLHDQEEIGMLNSKVTELENKIADIKANCGLAIEGRDIKIKELELELTVEKDQHQEEINLHLHAEDYIKSLEKENEELKNRLAQAKEIIKEWLRLHNSNTKKTIIKKSENFLKEIEK